MSAYHRESDKLQYDYYWKCDKKQFLIEYDSFRPVALGVWNIASKSDLDKLLLKYFDGYGELYSLLSEVLYEYVKNPLDKNLSSKYLEAFSVLHKYGGDWIYWDLARRLLASVNAYGYASLIHNYVDDLVLAYKNGDLMLRKFSILLSRGDQL